MMDMLLKLLTLEAVRHGIPNFGMSCLLIEKLPSSCDLRVYIARLMALN